jgi:Tfp pilus assembly protein PilF
VFGPKHPNTAASRNNLGWLLKEQGDFARARSLIECSLAIREKAFGSEHIYITWSLNNLGRLLQDQGDFAGHVRSLSGR